MGSETPGPGGPGPDALSLRPLEMKIALAGVAVLFGIAVAGRFGMLPGAACGAVIAFGNFYLIRKILEKAFSGEGTVKKWFIVPYALKFLGLVAIVYLVVRSGRFDVLGFLFGLSSLFLGILIEGVARAFKS